MLCCFIEWCRYWWLVVSFVIKEAWIIPVYEVQCSDESRYADARPNTEVPSPQDRTGQPPVSTTKIRDTHLKTACIQGKKHGLKEEQKKNT